MAKIVSTTQLLFQPSSEPGQLFNDEITVVRLSSEPRVGGTMLVPHREVDTAVIRLAVPPDVARRLAGRLKDAAQQPGEVLSVMLDALDERTGDAAALTLKAENARLRRRLATMKEFAENALRKQAGMDRDGDTTLELIFGDPTDDPPCTCHLPGGFAFCAAESHGPSSILTRHPDLAED